MKKGILHFFAATLVLGAVACSSTNTETATNTQTAEQTKPNNSAAATGIGTGTGTNNDTGTGTITRPDAARGGETTGGATASASAPLDSTSFPMMAASSDMFETLSSEMAQTRGMHAEVKRFAQHMLTDHGKTTSELKNLASRKNITLPTGPLPMHQRMLLPLSQATDGKKFDERYMEAQVMAHQQAVTLYETASKKETDPDLKAFATKTLPALRMHLDMAKKTKDLVD